MNSELIKTLADEARIKPMGSSWTYRHSDEFEEKFAELIVRECMANLYLNGYDDAMTQIQKHFGVAE